MRLITLNETVAALRELFVDIRDAADALLTGKTLTVQIVKAGGSLAAIAGSSAEVGTSGTYRISLAQADLNTEGEAMLVITAAGAITRTIRLQVTKLIREVHLVKARNCNRKQFTIDTGVLVVKDDDATTTLLTFAPSESGGVTTLDAS